MHEVKYEPIDCHFYDELEALAVKKVLSDIYYLEAKQQKHIKDYIVDFKQINKVEYVVLKEGTTIRLDYLIQVNDKIAPKTACNC